MELFINPITFTDLKKLQDKWGNYLKVTVDIINGWAVIGGELHADGEQVLLGKGSRQDDIWGGGINLKDKQIDTTAVLNLRPRLGNDNLEILDSGRREQFIKTVKKIFQILWP